ncbi:helix-turn-helix domain-containing protein [Cellulophaga baltica]|uniref:helix-turn-helix domain-containing protein n=1 Tax=Cellulophaga baltica TaxID=76594 RepID=UPI0015F599DF|nr:helix-turn-helix transcriptional regulator [Cellulophaga baltica]MBA6315971.1 helix-turn-helix transcriptional regulator [Cellulophaga baltica]
MASTFFIKNMVCNRCIASVLDVFTTEGYDVSTIELGKVVAQPSAHTEQKNLGKQLSALGFEIIQNEEESLLEQLKVRLIQKVHEENTAHLATMVARELGKTESYLSKLFSKLEGITLEKYTINLKIEKVKEYIQLGQLNFSEIAYTLNYKSSSHLARQFKTVTGMSMTTYKNLEQWNRKKLDQIV